MKLFSKKKSITEHKQDYERGIDRLKELEKELNSLDTRKFKKQERAIRKKLKEVSLIPEIEEDIRELRLRTLGVDVDFQKRQVDKRQENEIKKLSTKEDMLELEADQIPKLKKRIIELEQEEKESGRKSQQVLHLKRKLADLENKIQRFELPAFKEKRKLFQKEARKNFEVYSKGIERLKELERELNSLDTRKFKKQEKIIRAKLKDVSLIPEIEEDIRELRLRTLGVDVDYQKRRVDKRQEKAIKKLSKVDRILTEKIRNAEDALELKNEEVENLKAKIAGLEEEEKKSGNKSQQVPHLKKKLADLENRIHRFELPIFKKRKNLFIQAARRNFETYSKGIDRLKELERELNSLDTRKFKKQEKIIRAKLKDVSLIPEIEEDIRELRLRTLGVDVDFQKRQVDKWQEKEIKKLSSKEKILEFETEQIPKLKKKTSFLSKLFKKGEAELEELEEKVDRTQLGFYKRMNQELADSKRMIEQEKLELRKQMFDLLAESLNVLKKEKEEADKKILAEIEKVRNEMLAEKNDINEGVISKIVQLRSKIDKSKKEVEEETEKRIEELKKKIVEQETKISANQQEKPIIQAKPIIKKAEEPKLPEFKKLPPAKFRDIEEEWPSFPEWSALPKRFEPVKFKMPEKHATFEKHEVPHVIKQDDLPIKRAPPLPELPPLKAPAEKPAEKPREEPQKHLELSPLPKFSELPKFEVTQLSHREIKRAVEICEEKSIEKKKVIKPYIPSKKFVEYARFAEAVKNLDQIKSILGMRASKISKEIHNKQHEEKELEGCNERIMHVRTNIDKINSGFSWK